MSASLDSLFDSSVLTSLDTSKIESELALPAGATVLTPGPGLVVRPLHINDYEKGYTAVLSQLTDVGDVTRDVFQETFKKMRSCDNTYYVTVIEDTNTGKLVGSGTLLVEQKIIHSCASRGRLEDVVVSDVYRGKQLGKLCTPHGIRDAVLFLHQDPRGHGRRMVLTTETAAQIVGLVEDGKSQRYVDRTLRIQETTVRRAFQWYRETGSIEGVIGRPGLVLLLTRLAEALKCYKVSLDCKDTNRPFYEGLGYKRDEGNSNFMVIRYR